MQVSNIDTWWRHSPARLWLLVCTTSEVTRCIGLQGRFEIGCNSQNPISEWHWESSNSVATSRTGNTSSGSPIALTEFRVLPDRFCRHFFAKWFCLPQQSHDFPKAGQSSFGCRPCWRPQFQHSFVVSLLVVRDASLLVRFFWPENCRTAWTDVVALFDCPTIRICSVMLSAARQISSVLISVRLVSRNNRSRTFVSWIPKISLSLRISFGVIVSNSQASYSLRNVVLYCSYDSPLSCVRLLNLYLSKGTFFRGWQYSANFLRTGTIRRSSPSCAQSRNVE